MKERKRVIVGKEYRVRKRGEQDKELKVKVGGCILTGERRDCKLRKENGKRKEERELIEKGYGA